VAFERGPDAADEARLHVGNIMRKPKVSRHAEAVYELASSA
jgi:hypothetical protein